VPAPNGNLGAGPGSSAGLEGRSLRLGRCGFCAALGEFHTGATPLPCVRPLPCAVVAACRPPVSILPCCPLHPSVSVSGISRVRGARYRAEDRWWASPTGRWIVPPRGLLGHRDGVVEKTALVH
jgi:hypothetical protein